MMNRRYWAEIDGERIYRDSLAAIRRIAQDTADKLGRVVRVGYEDRPAARRNPARPAGGYVIEERDAHGVGLARSPISRDDAERIARQLRRAHPGQTYTVKAAEYEGRGHARRLKYPRFERNPDPGSFLPVWIEQERGRKMRLDYLAATKARRLAKGLRGRDRGGAVKAAERRAEKTGKFAVKARNAKEAFTLYRASRAAADALGAEFTAAGYKVTIAPV
jgi:hypothetical protein